MPEIAEKVTAEERKQLEVFLRTGDASSEFRARIDTSPALQEMIEERLEADVADLRKAILPAGANATGGEEARRELEKAVRRARPFRVGGQDSWRGWVSRLLSR